MFLYQKNYQHWGLPETFYIERICQFKREVKNTMFNVKEVVCFSFIPRIDLFITEVFVSCIGFCTFRMERKICGQNKGYYLNTFGLGVHPILFIYLFLLYKVFVSEYDWG